MAKVQKEKDVKSKVRINDLIRILKATEDVLKLESAEKDSLKSFIRELRNVLNPYKSLSGNTFLDILRNSLLTVGVKQVSILDEQAGIQFDIETISLDELRTLLSKNTLSKEQLLIIGEKRFGLSRGTLRKSTKKEIQDQIISAIQNIETLDVLKKKAAI